MTSFVMCENNNKFQINDSNISKSHQLMNDYDIDRYQLSYRATEMIKNIFYIQELERDVGRKWRQWFVIKHLYHKYFFHL